MLFNHPKTKIILFITFLVALGINLDTVAKATATNIIRRQGVSKWRPSNLDIAKSKQINQISDVDENTIVEFVSHYEITHNYRFSLL